MSLGIGALSGLWQVLYRASQVAPVKKNLPANAGDVRDVGLIPGLGRSPGEVNGNLLQYSCLKNPVDRGAWLATVQGVTRVGHDLVTKHHPPLQKYLIAGKTEMALQGTEIPLAIAFSELLWQIPSIGLSVAQLTLFG